MLSTVLCVATAVLWVWAAQTVRSVSTTRGHHIYSLDVHDGSLSFVSFWSRGGPYADWPLRFHDDFPVFRYPDAPYRWQHLGFGVQRLQFVMEAGDDQLSDVLHAFTVPLWFVCGLLGVLPLMTSRSMLRRRLGVATGRCLACGYDLRASPERCPECGHVPAGVNG